MAKRLKVYSVEVACTVTGGDVYRNGNYRNPAMARRHSIFVQVKGREPTRHDYYRHEVALAEKVARMNSYEREPVETSPIAVEIKPRKIRKHNPMAGRGRALSDSEWDAKALAYARWLAARDGIKLPDGKPRAMWSGVNNAITGKWEKRIMALEWGSEGSEWCYRKRRYVDTGWRCDFHFDLPNWDFNPAAPVETTEANDNATLPLSAAA